MRNMVLIGPRGSGKTCIGRALAHVLDVPFVDGDNEFMRRIGPIGDIVGDGSGWPRFRELEAQVVSQICSEYNGQGIIFSPGGGAVAHDQGEVYRKRNVENLQKFGYIVYLIPFIDLDRSAEILTERITRDPQSRSTRPSLDGNKDLVASTRAILEKRHSLYLETANRLYLTRSTSASNTANRLAQIYRHL